MSNPLDKIMSKTKIIYQDDDGQIHTAIGGGYDILITGNDKDGQRYKRLLSKLKLITGKKVKSTKKFTLTKDNTTRNAMIPGIPTPPSNRLWSGIINEGKP